MPRQFPFSFSESSHFPSAYSGVPRVLSSRCVHFALCGARALNTARSAFALLAAVARRRLWDLLLASKAGRVTLLTTHVLPEADTLGDVIGIMHEGSLKCAGSSLFLKRRFGVGYHLKVVRKSGAGPARFCGTGSQFPWPWSAHTFFCLARLVQAMLVMWSRPAVGTLLL